MVQPAPSVLGKRGPESHADVELKLRKDVAAPAAARAAVSELVCGLDVSGAFRETLALLVSELVTNAVIHSSTPDGTDVIVTTRVNDEVVRVTVTEVHVYRLRDGKITELREYREKSEALEAVGLAQ